ncbi:MAG: hypothetical protein QNK90_17280 [Opitutaceae bacterium]
MTITLATLITGLLLLILGVLILLPFPAIVTSIKRFPRSRTLAYVLFGTGAAWFLYRIANLSAADFGQYRKALFVFFAIVAIGSFKFVPDFLAVRGACVLILLAASPLLDASYMVWDYGEVTDFGRLYLYKIAIFVAVALAIYLGASPFRMRDFLEWLYRKPGRARLVGLVIACYGAIVSAVSFTY